MAPHFQDSPELVRRLVDANVELVVIGGIASIAWGSQQLTRDLDLVTAFDEANLERAMSVLRPLAPRFYQAHGKPEVTRSTAELSEFRNLYLQTALGIVDLLREVQPVGDFQVVASRAVTMDLYGRRCRVIALADLIAVKAHVGRPKDRLVELELRAIQDRMSRP